MLLCSAERIVQAVLRTRKVDVTFTPHHLTIIGESPTGLCPAAIYLAYSRDFLGGAGHGSDTASYRRVIRRVWGLARLRDHQLVEADVRRRNGNTGFDPMYGPASGCAAHQGYG